MVLTKDDYVQVIIAVILFVAVIMCGLYAACSELNRIDDRRVCYGTVVKCDGCNVEIITDDGLVWQVENYICQPRLRCRITFKMQRTDDHTDDEIISIVPEAYVLPSQIGG